jgi:hypothetical protein
MLRDLGAAVYAQKSGTATDQTSADIDRLVAELKAHEAENGAVSASADETDSTPDATTQTEPPPEGGFTL